MVRDDNPLFAGFDRYFDDMWERAAFIGNGEWGEGTMSEKLAKETVVTVETLIDTLQRQKYYSQEDVAFINDACAFAESHYGPYPPIRLANPISPMPVVRRKSW